MSTEITGRNFEVTPEIRELLERITDHHRDDGPRTVDEASRAAR